MLCVFFLLYLLTKRVHTASLEVMATLLVVGVMDDVRGDIQGNGNIQLNFAERLSQVKTGSAAPFSKNHIQLCCKAVREAMHLGIDSRIKMTSKTHKQTCHTASVGPFSD